ncbi:RagB/SusD family nutrient uptake outer membrane protein [Mucilaginibacter segetis]|uniref:RagB/SusD family nutrient uptake outer membrane protein n=1 Tax=Mucilaginibacter segetis TaxID=2793071 RepID=A0A934ULJ5_9SPHI|nr:RagB/SusD family nutrient uptake outer membrane protein [Mucilaginibacter segetis]MBK0378638.1 RagB/SusD family nutrient uptake outer membrane protein [Mucilaginibacter segetis]
MKKLSYKLIILGSVATLAFSMSCKKFLEKTPTGSLNTVVLANKAGVDGLLIGAYALVDGNYNGQLGDPWTSGTDNWIYGSVAADDAHKGSTPGDQPDAAAIEARTPTGVNGYLDPKWRAMFAGVQRANDVLREIPLVTDGSLTEDNIAQATAEARFLRGFFHFELAKIWRNVPYADETITYDNGNYTIGNPGPIWDKIAEDFKAAAAVLPATQPQVGRANKWAALAFEAKALLFDHKYTEANEILKDVIANGVTAGGAKYTLGHYADNFNPSTKNGPEGVFVVQTSIKDGANGLNGNAGNVLNFPSGGPATCCGFFQPSFSFVNAFKTDAVTGLPLVDTYNDSDLKNDQGVSESAAFTPTTATVDSRLDWSVGRRGIPYLDWGNHPGKAWARDQDDGGPYSPIKNVYYQAAQATTSDTYGGWAANQSTSNSYNAIRFADVILWAAECEVEVGSLDQARIYVNMIRARAADATGWVHTYIDPSKPTGGYTSTPAANYKVGLYPAGSFTDKATARKYVQFERRLELGMEGHRFFDLQRWDGITGGPMGNGWMAAQINSYLDHENHVPNFPILLIKGAVFTAGKNELFPIPQAQIDITQGNIKQNPGY